MDICPECGNSHVHAQRSAAGVVYVCELCGEQFGERRALAGNTAEDAARQRGVPAQMWPLVCCLERLPGFSLAGASAGADGGPAAAVELFLTGAEALRSLENLAKSLRLMAATLRCRWRLEVRFDLALTLSVTADATPFVREAWIDAEEMAERVERDQRLSWWRYADDAGNG